MVRIPEIYPLLGKVLAIDIIDVRRFTKHRSASRLSNSSTAYNLADYRSQDIYITGPDIYAHTAETPAYAPCSRVHLASPSSFRPSRLRISIGPDSDSPQTWPI